MINYPTIERWCRCSSEIWHFVKDVEDSEEIFSQIERKTFHELVLDGVDAQRYSGIKLNYTASKKMQVQRCHIQKNGNIYCRPADLELLHGVDYVVRRVDCRGTMTDHMYYIEVYIDQRTFFIQPFDESFELSQM